MTARKLGLLLAIGIAALGIALLLHRRDRVELVVLPDWSPELGHLVGTLDMARLGPDSLAILWRTSIEVENQFGQPSLVSRTCIAFGRPRQGSWSKPMIMEASRGSGSYMLYVRDTLHVFMRPPPRHFAFTSPDSFEELAEHRFRPEDHWFNDRLTRRSVHLPSGIVFHASLEQQFSQLDFLAHLSDPMRSSKVKLEVSRTVRGKRALREQSIDVSSLRSKDGLFGGIALAPGDEFAYLLVADNPPIVRSGKGISPRRLRSARLKLAIIR